MGQERFSNPNFIPPSHMKKIGQYDALNVNKLCY